MEKEKYYRAIGDKILSVERTETGKYKVNHVYTDPFLVECCRNRAKSVKIMLIGY